MNVKNLYEGGTEPKFITIDTHPKAFHEDQGCVRIISGEYADVIIQFDVIQAREEKNENGDNIAKFNFNFMICENPNDLDLTQQVFKDKLGNILQNLLQQHFKRQDAEQDRTSSTETSS